MRRFASTMATKTSRTFAPLRADANSDAPKLRGIVFDMDGTLCLPQNYMFPLMRDALGISKSVDILDHIKSLPTAEQEAAHEKIQNIEREAMVKQAPQPGLDALMGYLDSKAVPKAICTRNFPLPVEHLVGKFLTSHKPFAPVVTREFEPPKPHPAGILHIAKAWGLLSDDGQGDATGLIMVGDSIDDMAAGRAAGAATVLLTNAANAHLKEHDCTDLAITQLDELVDILERGFGTSIE